MPYAHTGLLDPRRATLGIQVSLHIVGFGPGARLVVVPADPRGRGRKAGHCTDGGRQSDKASQGVGEQTGGVVSPGKLITTVDKRLCGGAQVAQWGRPGKGLWTRKPGPPQIALHKNARCESFAAWANLDNYSPSVGQTEPENLGEVPRAKQDFNWL